MTPDLTVELRRLVSVAEADLRERADRGDLPWAVTLREEHAAALAAGRTALTWSAWRDAEVTQAAVAWVLGCVFVRFCEDNDLIAGRWIAGTGDGLARALDAETAFYTADPRRGTADWLRDAFARLAEQPGAGGILDRRHDPVWRIPIGDDTAKALLAYWRTTGPDGSPLRSLASPDLDTRFLGDLYQDLSEAAKKRYALLQTPDFVQEFILDRTLTPALAEFGLPGLRLIDPTCGSGHFLLGAFARLHAAWQQREPGLPPAEHAGRALAAVHGVDLNPYAAAIARFRLAVAALRAAGFTRLDQADFAVNVAVGDSLLGGNAQGTLIDGTGAAGFAYREEDIADHPGILEPGSYHVVVGNPPYITVKDKALNDTYRRNYPTCHRQYALSVPFMELFFRLAVRGDADRPAGYVGQITSNSFMKREFGAPLVETLLAGRDLANPVDLRDVIDTSGAYIPGHGTPTVILIGRRRRPVGPTVRAVLGVRGEPGQPADPAKGLVWTEIAERIDLPGHDGTYVTVTDLPRGALANHPWSLSGGGAGAVKAAMEHTPVRLSQVWELCGFGAITGEDEVFALPPHLAQRLDAAARPYMRGEDLRDYRSSEELSTIWPYRGAPGSWRAAIEPAVEQFLWPFRTGLKQRKRFGTPVADIPDVAWFEYREPYFARLDAPTLIAFAFVATHNHFVLDRGGKVFNRSAPVIKLPEGAGLEEHLGLLGILNTSAACFWLKQVCHMKGSQSGSGGFMHDHWEEFVEFTGTKLEEFPLPPALPAAYGRVLDGLAQDLTAASPAAVAASGTPTRSRLDAARAEHDRVRALMIAWQEESDWAAYHAYGLTETALVLPDGQEPPAIALGERAFEIALARRIADGEQDTVWFDRHGSTPTTAVPDHWPAAYRDLVARRLDATAADPAIGLLERPEFKRRWAAEPWAKREAAALTGWILDRAEDPALWSDAAGPRTLTVADLAAALRHDTALTQACAALTGRPDPDPAAVLAELADRESVPYLAAHRHTATGLAKHAEWEAVWDLQRREDAGEHVTIPVPPKYTNKDYRRPGYWAARGKLDVPKERFIAYPDTATGPSPVIGWAGWDHAERAKALARLLLDRQRTDGWDGDQLLPLLAGLAELEPWLHQWHDDPAPGCAVSPARAITGLLDQQLARLGTTRTHLQAWRPAEGGRGRRGAG